MEPLGVNVEEHEALVVQKGDALAVQLLKRAADHTSNTIANKKNNKNKTKTRSDQLILQLTRSSCGMEVISYSLIFLFEKVLPALLP